jgi:hypothetical protein
MRKIELTEAEVQWLIDHSHPMSALLTTVVSILHLRLEKVREDDNSIYDRVRLSLEAIGSATWALQRCEKDPVDSDGLDYVRDMVQVLKLPTSASALFEAAEFDTSIPFTIGINHQIGSKDLSKLFRDFKLKTGIDLSMIEPECPR